MKALLAVCLVLLLGTPLLAQEKLTPENLWEASREGNLEKVTQIIESGVDVNSKTEYGSTALFYACDRGHKELVKFLLDQGADPNAKDTFYNATPLTWAQSKSHNEIMGMLFTAGAKGADDMLPGAVASGNVDLTKMILDSGAASPSALRLAMTSAEKSKSDEIKALFADLEIPDTPDFEFTSEMAEKYVGSFASSEGQLLTITSKAEKLRAKSSGGTSLLKAVEADQFKSGQTTYQFTMDGDTPEQVSVEGFRSTVIYKAISEAEAEKLAAAAKEKAKPADAPKKDAAREFAESSPESKAADLAISDSNWPVFRGNGSRGVADGQSAPMQWNAEESKNVLWKTPIPGLGNSCPTIWENKLFVTSAVNPEADNDFRIGLYGDVASVEEDFEFDFIVYCLDKNSGKILWEKKANHAKPAVKRHAKSSHANPTVATNGEHVIAFFGSEGLYCYDMDGNLKWKKDLGVLDSGWFYDPGYQWGFGASPVIFEDKVILQCDIQQGSYVAAFRLSDGEEVWKTQRENEIPSWSSPVVHQFDDVAMLITHATRAARGYDARTGEELWSMKDHSEIVVPVPFVAHNLIYIASGYSPIQPIVAIRPEARGDITLAENSLTDENIAWSTKRGGPYMPSPIVYGDYLYCCANSGILTCYDAKTGDVAYKKRMRAKGGTLSFTGSPLAADGHLFLTTEDGRTLVVKAGPKFELVGTNSVGENVLTTPAISDGKLFIRGQQHVFALGKE